MKQQWLAKVHRLTLVIILIGLGVAIGYAVWGWPESSAVPSAVVSKYETDKSFYKVERCSSRQPISQDRSTVYLVEPAQPNFTATLYFYDARGKALGSQYVSDVPYENTPTLVDLSSYDCQVVISASIP